MEHEGTANTPFIENPQMEEWECSESMQTSEPYEVVCDLIQVGTPDLVVVHSQSEVIAQFGTQGPYDPTIEIFRSTVHEKEHWCTSDDLEALEEGFREGDACHSMLSVKDDTDERLPLYCQYVNGRLETVYHPLAGPYEFDHIEDLTSSSDL